MRRRTTRLLTLAALLACGLAVSLRTLAQRPDIVIPIVGERGTLRIAVPEFRGPTVPAAVNQVFNETLWNDLDSSGIFEMVSKSLYPTEAPQKPEDFKPPVAPPAAPLRRMRPGEKPAPPPPPVRQGPWVTDWSQPPVLAQLLAFGSTAVQEDRFLLSGWLYDVSKSEIGPAHIFGKKYISSNDAGGARKVAHEFSSDILQKLGAGPGIAGTRIYFVSNRTGQNNKEIWAMDYDGSNQTQLTRYNSLCLSPEISADGAQLAFTSFARGSPGIFIHSLETNRQIGRASCRERVYVLV